MLKATATIRLIRTEDGGRRTNLMAGCGAILRLGNLCTNAVITKLNRPEVPPGDHCEAELTFLTNHVISAASSFPVEFEMLDGVRVVGRGSLTSLFDNQREGQRGNE